MLITAVVAAWRAGAISRETMLERLKLGEVLPDGLLPVTCHSRLPRWQILSPDVPINI